MNDCCDATLCDGITRLLKIPEVLNALLMHVPKDKLICSKPFNLSDSEVTLKDIAFKYAWSKAT